MKLKIEEIIRIEGSILSFSPPHFPISPNVEENVIKRFDPKDIPHMQ